MTRNDRAAAFAAWARGSQPSLGRYAVMLTTNRTTADDLVQEALVRTYLHWDAVGPANANAYARRCMANLVTDWWRRRRFESRTELPDAPGADYFSPIDEHDRLLRALASLSPRERVIVVLRHYWGLSERETADELGVSLGTVKSTVSRALARLRSNPNLVGV